MKKLFIITAIIILTLSCSNCNKEFLELPHTNLNIEQNQYTFVFHFDLNGCFSCNASIGGVERFITQITEQTNLEFGVLIIVHATSEETTYIKNTTDCPYEIFTDTNNSFAKRNNITYDAYKNCYLINNKKRVLWQGNPIRQKADRINVCNIFNAPQLHKSKDFITEKEIDLGTFSWQTKQNAIFTIHNTTNDTFLIDTLYTSCVCTKAEIDKQYIAPSDSAVINVHLNPEKPEKFIREIYLNIHNKKQIVLSIIGEATE